MKPKDALTSGAMLQTARRMDGKIDSALVTTLARVRGQVASNHIGLHVQIGDPRVLERLRVYGAVTTRVRGRRGGLVLQDAVLVFATTQAVIDCFVIITPLTAAMLLSVVVFPHSAPEGPASPQLFRVRGAKPP